MLQNDDTAKLTFARKLKSIRISLHITQRTLAELTGIYYNRVSEYECGKRLPTQKTLDSLCMVLKRYEVHDTTVRQLIKAWEVSVSSSSGRVSGRVFR